MIMSYPRFNYRSGKVMSLSRRINDCFERSLNGLAIDTNSQEMQAIIAYMHWIGDDIPKNNKPVGSGIMQLPFLNRPADTVKGRKVYANICQRCHGRSWAGTVKCQWHSAMYTLRCGAENSYNAGAGIISPFNVCRLCKKQHAFSRSNLMTIPHLRTKKRGM